MKRLVVCCDGTWNNPEQEDNGFHAPTNVFKLSNCVAATAPDGTKQMVYYHPGVGGEGGIFKPIAGGAVGAGISRHICSAYHWIANNYEEKDEIFLYGFSRGAFTARSLASFIGKGLLNLSGLTPKESWRRVHHAYDQGYRVKDSLQKDWAEPEWQFFDKGKDTKVRFLGVWDTVGALGVPDDLEILDFFDNKSKWEFHNTDLADHITTARHAMAIDEMRSCFCVTRWKNCKTHNDCKEVWFPGVHSDVGGGYVQTGLSSAALLWMIEESEKAHLEFRPKIKEQIKPFPLGTLHNSYKGAFAALRSRPRNVEAITRKNAELFHPNVFERQENSPIEYPAYRPTRILQPGESITVDVFAVNHWNETGVYLDKDHSYIFSATGEWKDSKDACDWLGTEVDKYTLGDLVRTAGSVLGHLENTFKAITKNKSTDFWLTKRVEKLPWFTLVGAIANDSGQINSVANDGSPTPHQYEQLSKYLKEPLVVKNPGYLYCFANDVWSKYENNSGSLQLTITRLK